MFNKTVIFLYTLIYFTPGIIAARSSKNTRSVSGTAYIECLWFCVTIMTNVDLIVTSSGLNRGKWIKNSLDFTRQPNPVGKRALPGEPLMLCSSGLEDTPYGTEGYAWLSTYENEKIKFTWAHHYVGHGNHSVVYEEKYFRVTWKTIKEESVKYDVSRL